MTRAIIFDMDGTITLTEAFHIEVLTALFAELGMTYDSAEHMKRFAGAGTKIIVAEMFKQHGREISVEEIEKLVVRKRDMYTKFVQSHEIPFVPGVQEFVAQIEAQGIKKIIATGNGDLDAVRFLLGKIGLGGHFPEVVSIKEVPRGKPFPDVFIEAAHRLNVPLNECVVLEDSANGVQAAHDGGIRCIAFETTTDKKALLEAGASFVIPDYRSITPEMLL